MFLRFSVIACQRDVGVSNPFSRTLALRSGLPLATTVFAAVNVVIFVLTHNFLDVATLTGDSLRQSALIDAALYGPYVDVNGEWWRIITGAFLHANLSHLFFNVLVMYLLGRRLESSVGSALLTGTYLLAMLAGSAGALLNSPAAVTVGASGAVYGLMGCAYVVEQRSGRNPWRDGLGSLIIINVVVSFLIPNISIGGHIGGLAGGVLAALAIGDLRRQLHWAITWALLAVSGAAMVVLALWAATGWRDPLF